MLAQKLGFSKIYELPIAKTYVRHWGMTEGVREILQNALDSESPFEYEVRKDEDTFTLIVRSRFAKLDASTLLLGATSKADSRETIGSFGEGYKIALLVLLRCGYDIFIRNGDRLWVPKFILSKQFNAEVLCVEDFAADSHNEGLAFEISGLTAGDIEGVRDSCLHMQNDIGEVIETQYGRILRKRRGKLYIGGLFICDTRLEFGYDVKPEHMKLERDRQTVSTFDLQLLTKDMWFETGLWDEIAFHMDKEIPDLEYAEYGCPELVKEACYRRFKEQHPGHVIAKTNEEMKSLVEKGMTKVVVRSGGYSDGVRSSASYNHDYRSAVQVANPTEILTTWFEDNRRHMRRDAITAFKALVDKSSDWRIK